MARILNVSEDNYRLKVQSGGHITLDTGVAVGEVRITGNLIVEGEYTTINVSDMTVEDNIIVLNNGELGAGITEGTSGLTIDRGSLSNAEFLFDESISHYDPYKTPTPGDNTGTFVLKTANDNLTGLQLSTIVSDSLHNLYFDMTNTTNVLELVNITPDDYANEVFGSDTKPDFSSIPETDEGNYLLNKRFLHLYIQSGIVSPGMADVDKIYKSVSGDVRTRVQTYETNIKVFTTDLTGPDPSSPQLERIRIDNTGFNIIKSSVGVSPPYIITYTDTINLFNDTINNVSNDLILKSTSTDNVMIDGIFNLKNRTVAPVASSGKTKIFSMSQSTLLSETPGRTGIFFANNVSSDELVAKNRALLFSILF